MISTMISLDAYETLTRLGRGPSTAGSQALRGSTGKEIDMASETIGAEQTRPADVGLRREIGLVGATWASETSIIGSGWLFGAFGAAQAAGTSALLGWVIGGGVVIILA